MWEEMSRRWTTVALAALFATLATADAAQAASYAPGELEVRWHGQRFGAAVALPRGLGVREAARALRENPRVAYAVPNYVATASDLPDDPGTPPGRAGRPGGWVSKQWNFLPCGSLCAPGARAARFQSRGGINAVGAWRRLASAGHAGAAGVTVAVLDTGIAYRSSGRFRRSPDFSPGQFVPGRDVVDGDRRPIDENGHGTHIAGTIAERTDNGIGVTGLAYRARLMPVRVLNELGRGQADDIARGIRFAVRNGVDIINMSFNFACRASVPDVVASIRFAHRHGVVVVASVGNATTEACVSPPATAPHVIGVGGTTVGACLGGYSLKGRAVDLVAPGGGSPVSGCPSRADRPIFQLTFRRTSPGHFALPDYYVGTSMAAAHVAGAAAMVIASGVIGVQPTPGQVADRLEATARDLGAPGPDTGFGAGLIDAARATNPSI
jgi:serine protease